jgi:CDP-glucose 4,6-dehydratase
MTFLLEHLEIPVVGYALPAEKDSLYVRAERSGAIPEVLADIRDYQALEAFINLHRPSTIIHMAAQPLVLKSYESPRETFDVNVLGTVNTLDIAFKKDFVKAVIIVTTDKVYRNDNSGRAFVESDPLEGKDPYSASKVATEAAISAWQQIAKVSGGPKVVSVRAGNVIGGGDFADNRIVPDLIKCLMHGRATTIRNPNSSRPWQHVIEPLVGYISCLEHSLTGKQIDSLNFGPNGPSLTVRDVIEFGSRVFPRLNQLLTISQQSDFDLEARNLSISIDASQRLINWAPLWRSDEAILKTFEWWEKYLACSSSAMELCVSDISTYFKIFEFSKRPIDENR